jgi:hypothetical protein
MAEHELGSDLGQLADNLLWQMRNYLNAVHSRFTAIEAALAVEAPPVEQIPGNGEVEREEHKLINRPGVKPPVGRTTTL